MNASIEALLILANEELGKKNPTEACDRLINVLTAHIEISDILDSIESATSLLDVYEACDAFVKVTKKKLESEEIRCDSVFKMIQEDVALERAYTEVLK